MRAIRGPASRPPRAEPLGVLLLPSRLEEFALADHARDLLAIPRVVAVEPARLRSPRLTGSDVVIIRQARRLRFPGRPRVLVLFHPRQYRLARALSAKHDAEIWYVAGGPFEPLQAGGEEVDLRLFDQRAREVAAGVIQARAGQDPRTDNRPLRERLVELEIISSRPFVPGARIGRR